LYFFVIINQQAADTGLVILDCTGSNLVL
jgi:hypothetical protein